MSYNYFFRFGQGNKIFIQNYEPIDARDITIGFKKKSTGESVDEIWLAIYYSKFTAHHFYHDEEFKTKRWKKGDVGGISISGNEYSQCSIFFKAPKGSMFWLYLSEVIVCVEALTDGSLENVKCEIEFDSLNLSDNESTIPKSRKFRIKKIIHRTKAPELFVTLDSSRIQGTILKLDELPAKKENIEIGNAILSNVPIPLTSIRQALKYLAPVQLETLLFKLFNDNGYYASAFRGGSKFLVDLVVQKSSNHSLSIFPDSELQFQIKRTSGISYYDAKGCYFDKDIYFVTIDEHAEKKFEQHNEALFIGPSRLEQILLQPNAIQCVQWVKAVLGEKFFIHNY